jgi:hypothetical protein
MFFFMTINTGSYIAICSLKTNSMNMKVLCVPAAKCLFESLSVIKIPLTKLSEMGLFELKKSDYQCPAWNR